MSRVLLLGGSAETAQRAIRETRVEPSIGPRKMGLIIFLSSESILFLTFIAQYVVGQFNPSPPTPSTLLDPLRMLGFSVALWASSGTMQLAIIGLRRRRFSAMRLWLLATIVLGLVFLIGEASEWADLFGRQVSGSVNIWATTFFSLTGLHGLHVVFGLALMTGLVLFSWVKTPSTSGDGGPEVVAIYWHFVDGMWVFIYAAVYIWSAAFGG